MNAQEAKFEEASQLEAADRAAALSKAKGKEDVLLWLNSVAAKCQKASIKAQAEEGNVVSPCRKSNTSPVARTAPAFICEALPFGALSTLHW